MSRLLVVLAAALFGTTGTAQALGPDASPIAVGAARIAVGAVLLLAAARLVRGASGGGGAWSRRWLAAAAVGIAGYQLAFFAAVADTGVAVGTVVALGSAPALAGLLGRAVDGTALDGRWAACTALATAGVLLLVLGGADAEVSAFGIALALGAGLAFATYTVASKRLLADGHAPEEVMARGFGLAAVALSPVLVLHGGDVLSVEGVALALYLGAIPTAVAYVLFARGLQRLSAGETATLTLAEPLTAAMLGTLVLAERPGAVGIAGAALVLAGLAALAAPQRSARHARTSPRPAEARA
jgi:drug/metabolite transporter, DME family